MEMQSIVELVPDLYLGRWNFLGLPPIRGGCLLGRWIGSGLPHFERGLLLGRYVIRGCVLSNAVRRQVGILQGVSGIPLSLRVAADLAVDRVLEEAVVDFPLDHRFVSIENELVLELQVL